MIKTLTLFGSLIGSLLITVNASQWQLSSPDNQNKVEIKLSSQGCLSYQLYREQTLVVQPSALGFTFADQDQPDCGYQLKAKAKTLTIEDSYQLFTGKQSQHTYEHNELQLDFSSPRLDTMKLHVRMANDGLAFKYQFDTNTPVPVSGELTAFNFSEQAVTWSQIKAKARSGWKQTNPSYEEDYIQQHPINQLPESENGWIYPTLVKDGAHWLAVTESDIQADYPASNLSHAPSSNGFQLRFPDMRENTKPAINGNYILTQAVTPWRVVAFGSLADVFHSHLVTDLASPSQGDTRWIKPGIASWSWGLLKDESVNYDTQKAFIDHSAQLNWDYTLVDVNWDQNIGYERIQQLVDYAASKSVGLLLWYNSSGQWNNTPYTPKSALIDRQARRKEFARIQQMGIKGVKIDFFPGDGASVVAYYHDILQDAMDHQLLVNFHGTTLPRGLHRTYPNLMTVEAVKGFEMITFFQAFADQEATHVSVLPFTRNLFDPMDFTPMTLGNISGIERTTTDSFQLALPIVMTSGIQHLVATPEQIAKQPAFVHNYLQHLPKQWQSSRLISGYPGEHIVVERKASAQTYIAGINGTNKAITVALDKKQQQCGRLIHDHKLQLTERKWCGQSITIAPNAGFVLLVD